MICEHCGKEFHKEVIATFNGKDVCEDLLLKTVYPRSSTLKGDGIRCQSVE